MTSFRTRIKKKASESSGLILACDYPSADRIKPKTLHHIRTLGRYLCAIKLNFHLLLPLGASDISRITDAAHKSGLQVIADIKLNDIGNTNTVTLQHLWAMGADAVIANPIMGPDGLRQAVLQAHRDGRGLISLYHMSAKSARQAYETGVLPGRNRSLYQMFLDWAVQCRVDGVVAGATYPGIIRECKKNTNLDVYSPGVGVQGGSMQEALEAGADYLIVGRSIIGADSPREMARSLSGQIRYGVAGP